VQTVLDLTAGTRRGKAADAARRAAVVAAVRALEAANPTSSPTSSDLLAGDWALLWTGPADPTDAAWEKRSGGLEGPVLSALAPVGRVLGLAGGAVIQSIDTTANAVHNVATFKVLGQPGSLDVEGDVVVASPTRVDVTFTRFTLRVGGLPAISIPLTAVSPTGWVETTYLDERVRVGRGDKGSLFVTARVPANGPLAADKRKG
jgi:PAP_fibrillin